MQKLAFFVVLNIKIIRKMLNIFGKFLKFVY